MFSGNTCTLSVMDTVPLGPPDRELSGVLVS